MRAAQRNLLYDILGIELLTYDPEGFEKLCRLGVPRTVLAAKPEKEGRDNLPGPRIVDVALGRETRCVRNALAVGGRFGSLAILVFLDRNDGL
jgi:hypothetical protein